MIELITTNVGAVLAFICALVVVAMIIFFTVSWAHEKLYGKPTEACPNCGNDDIRKTGTKFGRTEIVESQCADCRAYWVRGVREETEW